MCKLHHLSCSKLGYRQKIQESMQLSWGDDSQKGE